MRRFRALPVLALLASCAPDAPAIVDGSSPQSFERSVAAAREDVPAADRLTFDRAIRTVGGRRLARHDPAALARLTFDGMTGPQIVADQKARER